MLDPRRINTHLIFIVTLMLMWSSLCAQRIQNFNVISAESKVAVRFTISKGNSCNGYRIYHSVDTVNFKLVGDVAEICGSTSEDEHKSYTHNNPVLNSVNYYKVDLYPVEMSKIVGVYVANPNNEGIELFPNPMQSPDNILYLRLSNDKPVNLKGRIYDLSGKILREFNFTTLTNLQALDITELRNGFYFLWLSDNLQNYSTKFVIRR